MPCLIMGVLNVTPDSFSDGGRWPDRDAAVAQGLRMVADGADIVDIGGESTRPGADPVDEATERERVLPVIEALAPYVRVSVDTAKPGIAAAAAEAGATILNDVTASLHDAAAALGMGWIAMHMQGTPRTMQEQPTYDDVVAEVRDFLLERAEKGRAAGVGEIWIDPGIGFGKTAHHNLSLLKHLTALTAAGWPVALGASRKSFLGRLTGDGPVPAGVDDRLEASLAVATWSMLHGAAIVRVHDVAETVRAARVAGVAGVAA
jgi:dihydropteroate synthase